MFRKGLNKYAFQRSDFASNFHCVGPFDEERFEISSPLRISNEGCQMIVSCICIIMRPTLRHFNERRLATLRMIGALELKSPGMAANDG